MFSDLSLSFFILLLFIVLFGIDYFAIGFKKIKEEWPKYKCNPVVMPFAGTLGYDTNANFISWWLIRNCKRRIRHIFRRSGYFSTYSDGFLLGHPSIMKKQCCSA